MRFSRLYHGTTLNFARKILAGGFKKKRHDVMLAKSVNDASKWGMYIIIVNSSNLKIAPISMFYKYWGKGRSVAKDFIGHTYDGIEEDIGRNNYAITIWNEKKLKPIGMIVDDE
jgi:hypothetical protein